MHNAASPKGPRTPFAAPESPVVHIGMVASRADVMGGSACDDSEEDPGQVTTTVNILEGAPAPKLQSSGGLKRGPIGIVRGLALVRGHERREVGGHGVRARRDQSCGASLGGGADET